MLYATTRNPADAFTAQRVLTQKRGSDGGLFVPFRLTRLAQEDILSLGSRGFNSNVADVLNHFFGSRLTGYDIDLAIGRRCVRLQQLGQKILMGECWHNTDWDFSRTVRDLASLVLADRDQTPELQGWAGIGIRIAVLFGLFGELIREGIAGPGKTVDVACVSGDFSRPMAAWYAKAMGLPVGNILCCCNENAALWDFICHGQLRTDGVAVQTLVPEADIVVPESLERLICAYGGPEETGHYVRQVHQGRSYYADDAFLNRLRQGLYVTVSSEKRILRTIPSAYGTHGYLLAPSAALVYAGLQDYRARTGSMQPALILAERSPVLDRETVADAMGAAAGDPGSFI